MSQTAEQLTAQQEVETLHTLIFQERVYQNHPYPIPILKVGERLYITGQNLEYSKMVGEKPLTEQERKEYPYVINPLSIYRATHRQKFDISDPQQRALYKLLILTGDIAPSEAEYNMSPAKFKGYFFNRHKAAQDQIDEMDYIYKAMTFIKSLPDHELRSVASMLNIIITDKEFFIPVQKATIPTIKNDLMKAAQKFPKQVVQADPKENPGIEQERHIVDLISNKVLTRKQDGSIYFNREYVAADFAGVKKYMANPENDTKLKRWAIMLDEKKGIATKTDVKEVTNESDPMQDYLDLSSKLKSALFDKLVDESVSYMKELEVAYQSVKNKYPAFDQDDEIKRLNDKVDELLTMTKKSEKSEDKSEHNISEFNKLTEEFSAMKFEELEKKIRYPKSIWRVSECKKELDSKDKDALVNYMVKTQLESS